MYSELECGICYQIYNAGRRCPRELQCKHTFCESCLLALSRTQGPDKARLRPATLIVCPLCRHVTSISVEEATRSALRVDECVLERLMASGVLEQEEGLVEEDEEDEVESDCEDQVILPEISAEEEEEEEEEDSSQGSRAGSLWRSLRRVWGKISGRSARRRRGELCMTSDDLRNFAMMSCYMF
ncbi:hypothetical protein LDENG_00021320 [Lucifuga dentata]|nr:hypothetical protein LDENG_00021320 [Lucifuga dentata]